MAYTYDNNGNQTAAGADTFVWDAEDRLTSWTRLSGTVTTTSIYNGDGLRDKRTIGSAATETFTWDLGLSIPQTLDDGTLKYVHGLGRIAQVGASTHYYLPDGLGSTMALVDSTGAVVNTYNYDVFGFFRSGSVPQPNQYLFAGEQTQAGIQYLRARHYDTAPGRFLSKDPVPGIVGLPLSQNRYPYVLNNPVNLLDPSGLCVFGAPCPQPIKKAIDAADCAIDPLRCGVNGAITTVGNALGLNDLGYLDVNVTLGCGLVGTGGVQLSFGEGIHPYVGGGVASYCGASASVTLAPAQRIATGLFCGAQFGVNLPLGVTGVFQVGAGPVLQVGSAGGQLGGKEGLSFAGEFLEIGGGASIAIGVPGIPSTLSGTCGWVF